MPWVCRRSGLRTRSPYWLAGLGAFEGVAKVVGGGGGVGLFAVVLVDDGIVVLGGVEAFEVFCLRLGNGGIFEGCGGGAEGGDGPDGGGALVFLLLCEAGEVVVGLGDLRVAGGGEGAGFAGDVIDVVGLGEVDAFLGGAEFLELFGTGEDAGFEGAEGPVVVFDGGVEGAAHLGEVIGEGGDAGVEFAADLGDLVGVFGEGFLAPAEGDGAEEGDEGGGGGEDDALVDTFLDEGGVLGEGGGEDGFAGEEEDHELGGGGELVLVGLGRELADVIADLPGVAEEGGVAGGVVLGLEGVEVGVHGGLGIDDDLLAGGEFDDEIGADAAALGVGGGGLGDEVAVFDHAGHFDDSAELHFTPLAAADGLAEGFDELAGFLLEAALGLDHVADLLVEGGVGAFAGFFEVADAGLDLFEGIGDWFDHALDGLAALFDVAFGLLLLGTEGGAGKVEELLL